MKYWWSLSVSVFPSISCGCSEEGGFCNLGMLHSRNVVLTVTPAAVFRTQFQAYTFFLLEFAIE